MTKRKWLILSILGTVVVFGALRTLMETPLYTTGIRLQIDRNVAKVVEGGNVAPTEGAYDLDFLRTQYELLKSRAMAERVASELRLADDADFFKPREVSILSVLRGMISAGASPENKAPNKAALQSAAAGMGGQDGPPAPRSPVGFDKEIVRKQRAQHPIHAPSMRPTFAHDRAVGLKVLAFQMLERNAFAARMGIDRDPRHCFVRH